MTNRLSYEKIKDISVWWKDSGGLLKVEVAALEPLIWRDHDRNICDVISFLKSIGFTVSLTTNGSTLSHYAKGLKVAGLDLLRVSWHSLDEQVFSKITGGGNLKHIHKGIVSAIESGLDVKINRVLLKGYIDDLGRQIDFIDKYKATLKLLDLYWTPSSASMYDKYYISPQDALEPFLEKITPSNKSYASTGRKRALFVTSNGGDVEYKIKESAEKSNAICNKCTFRSNCLEGYSDYFRVYPSGDASLCYLRKDLSTKNYSSIFNGGQMPLRLVLEGRCNYNCGFPNEVESWCLKQGRGFKFPDRKRFIEIHNEL